MVFSEKLASIGLLSAGVAHEINNPLETIHNFVEYLKYKIEQEEDKEILADIDEEVETISKIVSNLITFSDNNIDQNESFDVNSLIDDLIGLINYNAKYKKIQIDFHKKDDRLTLTASKTEIKQVILNLIKNSFDAIPAGGIITIKTCGKRLNEKSYVEIVLIDNGTGIPGKNINDIFLPFYSTKSNEEGNLGLGLSVSYGILKKYNGTISVLNLEEEGCQFTITIPQQQ